MSEHEVASGVSLKRYRSLLQTAADLAEQNQNLKRQKVGWEREKVLRACKRLDPERCIPKKQLVHFLTEKSVKSRSKPSKVSKTRGSTLKAFEPVRKSRVALTIEGGPDSSVRISDRHCVFALAGRPCKLHAIKGFDYCHHHAAFDPKTGYTWCKHVDNNGRSCQIAVLKSEFPFCLYHEKLHQPPAGWTKRTTRKRARRPPAKAKPDDSAAEPSTAQTDSEPAAKRRVTRGQQYREVANEEEEAVDVDVPMTNDDEHMLKVEEEERKPKMDISPTKINDNMHDDMFQDTLQGDPIQGLGMEGLEMGFEDFGSSSNFLGNWDNEND